MMFALPATFHWRLISKEPECPVSEVRDDLEADVVVVGGGLTGLAAALRFAKTGEKVVVLDAGRIGQGASGRNNGQVIPHHSRNSPMEIERIFGSHRGGIFNRMVGRAAQHVADIIREHAIDCDFVQRGWVQAAHAPSVVPRLRTFYGQWNQLGYDVDWLERDAMSACIGSTSFYGGWRAKSGGYLNPYAFCQGMARAAVQAGAHIYQDSAVTDIRREGGRWQLACPGGKVTARQVLITANIPQSSFWPGIRKVSVPLHVYQVSTGPLDENWQARVLPGREGVSDTSRIIRAFRYDSTGGLAMVGLHTLWHDAANRGLRDVAARLREIFPGLPLSVADRYWEGIFAVVPDRFPRMMALGPGLHFSGIYSGRGVALSVQWGAMTADLMLGKTAERDLPVPMTGLRTVPFHAMGVQYGRYMHPLHAVQDRIDAMKKS
ncbi:FAD-binding oxidoreductase [Acetobacter sp. TBRC 12305]|uniref:FAD-binding oxidoreductase n=1 Tax=Acetobacter garciniae TaxID=2817435 RepID=A0A939HQZ9_9PROT|nr:FAD-dependent oxidoreductase [Acetobacter garciniae]MBO1326104.1 FAD-binding oxidoreductase [Acetobacter garciniae]MBX0345151.1 FAD-binding oxidoreductase [Acetobacter garciniae]